MTATPDYEAWTGREETREARLDAAAVEAMAATLDIASAPAAGAPLPPGWQWLFFNPAVRRSGLGPDGHPQRGGFLPPIALPRRMWAGSRIRYRAALPVDARATKRSRILKVQNKSGRRGPLWFVTVAHTISVGDSVAIEEEQDIVYREAAPAAGAPAAGAPAAGAPAAGAPAAGAPAAGAAPVAAAVEPEPHADTARWSEIFQPDTTLLFRYSALTFNGHRIHYDQAYARQQEGYPDLVVHGPLTATLLQRFALEHGDGRMLGGFDFRGVSPLFVDRAFRLEGRPEADGSLVLWARGPDGELAMSATATFR